MSQSYSGNDLVTELTVNFAFGCFKCRIVKITIEYNPLITFLLLTFASSFSNCWGFLQVCTYGIHQPIGSLYGFELLVKSETTVKDGFDLIQNRFFVRGEGQILYNYNYGSLAADPKTASQNFLNALDGMPKLLEKYQTDTDKRMQDVPILTQIVKSVWNKECELKDLKAELTTLERKIELSLKPIEQSEGITTDTSDGAKNGISSIPKELQEAKEVMGDRLIIARPANGVHIRNQRYCV